MDPFPAKAQMQTKCKPGNDKSKDGNHIETVYCRVECGRVCMDETS